MCERWSWWPHKWTVELFCLLQCSWRAQIAGLHSGETRWTVTEGAGIYRVRSGRGDSSRVASFPKQRVSGQLIAEEDLWLADTREFLSNCPEWPMAEATGMQAEGSPMLSNICILKILLGKDEGPWGSYQDLSKKRIKKNQQFEQKLGTDKHVMFSVWTLQSPALQILSSSVIEAKMNLRLSRKNSRDACSPWISLLGKKANSGYEKRTQLGIPQRQISLSNFACLNIQSLRVSKAVDSKLSAKMIFGSLLLTGQLTEHLRRKSEQTLVAAADLRLSALFLKVFGWDMVATLMGIDWYSIDGYVSLWLQCNMNENMQWIQEIHTCVLFFYQWRDSSRQNRRFFDQGTVFTQVILKHLSQASGELVTAVQRDALSVQAEEEALCKAEEEGTIRILHSVLSVYEIYWNRLRSWFLAIFQSFHLVHSMTPSIHLLCSGSFKQIPIRSLRASVPRYYQTQFWDGHLSLLLCSRSCFSAANVAPQSCKNSGKIWIFARRPLKKQPRRLGPNCRVCIGK